MSLPSIPERVAAGVAWLDEHVGPEWPERVVLDEFSIKSPCRCVLGFVYEGKSSLLEDGFAFALDRYFGGDQETAAELGFDFGPGERGPVVYPLLQTEWHKFIAERQASL